MGAGTALYLAGITDPADLAYALVAAFLPVLLRALNKSDPAFGLIASAIPAQLQKGEAVIPKEYLDKNREAVEKLVAEARKQNKDAATKAKSTAKAPVKKAPTKKK